MATLNIGGQRVKVDDSFMSMSADDQSRTVSEIEAQLSAQKPSEPLAGGFADRAARETMPTRDEMKGAYREMASGVREQQGTVGKYADTAMRGLARAVPFMDDIAAAGDYLTGKNDSYTDALDRQRAMNQVDDTDRPVTSYGAQVVGGVALPAGALKPGAGFAANAITGAKVGGIYGALHGAGSGDGLGDRAWKAGSGAVVGAPVGGVLGGLLGKFLPSTAPVAPPTQGFTGPQVVAAGERLGVDVPKAVATDSMMLQRAGAGARNVPFAGDPLVKASERTVAQLGEKATETAAGFGNANVLQTGERAADAIIDFVGPKLRAVSAKAYEGLDNAMAGSETVLHPLANTQGQVAEMLAKNAASAKSKLGDAINEVSEAVTRPGGLTYEGLKDLRSRIGANTSSHLVKADEQIEFGRLYGSLTRDMEAAVEKIGGKAAIKEFEMANKIHELGMEKKALLEKIVGKSGDKAGESVYQNIAAAASSGARADNYLLNTARQAIGKDAWDDIAATVIGNLGRDVEGKFSPARFVTGFGKISENGKNALFGSNQQLYGALKDIATVSSRSAELMKFANPSGTAQNLTSGAIGIGMMADPLRTVSTIVAGNVLSRILASPATASSMAKWSRAYEMAVRKPSAGTLSTLQLAARNFSATASEQLGIPSIMKQLQGTVHSRADGQDKQ